MHATLKVKGETFYIVPEADYRSFVGGLRNDQPVAPSDDTTGDMDAMTAVRLSIAKTIIRDREALGWSQADLAREAGVNVETLNRIERGKVLASSNTVARLESAIKKKRKANQLAKPVSHRRQR